MSWDKADTFLTYHWMRHWEQKLMRAASPFLDDRHEPPFQECMKLATPTMEFTCGGEGKLSIGRAIKFAQQGAAMVVNCAPFGCMPETVATSVFGRVSADVDVPIVDMETLEGFPYPRPLPATLPTARCARPRAFRLRRAKPSFADATCMFYDGNGGQNRRLEVFLNNAVSGKRQTGHTQIGGDVQPGWNGKDRLVPVENLTSRIRPSGDAGESA
jgi:hypothetical protein